MKKYLLMNITNGNEKVCFDTGEQLMDKQTVIKKAKELKRVFPNQLYCVLEIAKSYPVHVTTIAKVEGMPNA